MLPVYHGVTEQVLSHGIGHIPTTALPVGGLGTHSVLAGHRGLPSQKLFTDLDTLELGDEFYLEILGKTLAYEIDDIQIVAPEDTNSLRPQSDQDYVTLATCTPLGINSHRLLVRGTRIEYIPPSKSDAPVRSGLSDADLQLILGASLAILVMGMIVLVVWRRKRR
jgi:sortase A